ncbi:MAG: alpha/beta hydrolase fold domain-containing protein [Rubripirellula sp.]
MLHAGSDFATTYSQQLSGMHSNRRTHRPLSVLFLLASFAQTFCFNGEPADAVEVEPRHENLVYATVDGKPLKLDLYLPNDDTVKAPLVVWIHGGGWRGGSKSRVPLKSIVENGFALASINYRFTDTALFPAQIHDCKGAIRWLRSQADTYGYDADWIAVAGSSAGGHLALLVGTSGDVKELEGDTGGNLQHSSRVDAIIDYFGPSDFVLRGKTQPERAYTQKSGSFALLGGVQDGSIDPEMELQASPTTYIDATDPPLLIFHGSQDKTVLLDQSERMHAAYGSMGLKSTLVILDGAGHGGTAFYREKPIKQAVTFLQQCSPAHAAHSKNP